MNQNCELVWIGEYIKRNYRIIFRWQGWSRHSLLVCLCFIFLVLVVTTFLTRIFFVVTTCWTVSGSSSIVKQWPGLFLFEYFSRPVRERRLSSHGFNFITATSKKDFGINLAVQSMHSPRKNKKNYKWNINIIINYIE